MPSVDEPSTSPDSSATGCLSNTSGGSNVLLRLPEPLAELFVDIGLDDPDWPPEPVGPLGWPVLVALHPTSSSPPATTAVIARTRTTGPFCTWNVVPYRTAVNRIQARKPRSSVSSRVLKLVATLVGRPNPPTRSSSTKPCRALRTVRTACTAAAPVNP